MARVVPTGLAASARRALYRVWGRLPDSLQGLLVRLAAPKMTLGVCAVVVDGPGRLLVAHHTYRGRSWGLPGGFATGDEQPHQTLEREVREELGVAATVGTLIHAEAEGPGRHLTLYYRVTIDGTPRIDGVEIDGYRYVAADEIPTLFGPREPRWLAPVRAAIASEHGHAA